MWTLGDETVNNITHGELHAVQLSYEAEADLVAGNFAKAGSVAGTVDIATENDYPLGVVVVGAVTGKKATILTPFCLVAKGTVDDAGDVTYGAKLATTGSTAGKTDYKVAEEGEIVVAIALADADDTEEVLVGILRCPSTLVVEVVS